MGADTYYRDHWITVEPERFAYYDSLFRVPEPVIAKLLAPLAIERGHVCVDLGCGPGYLVAAMATRAGADGHVHGVDVNADFLQRARAVNAEGGVDAVCSFHHMLDEVLPLDDETVDRALAKNVLEYVPDLAATLGELYRVVRPGGRLLAIDSDWGFMVAEPLSADEVREVLTAASPAFREPHIGRKLRGAFVAAGFIDVQVDVIAFADVGGVLRGVLDNMVRYGIEFERLPDARATEVRLRLDAAQQDGSFLVVLPQFVVTGTKPG